MVTGRAEIVDDAFKRRTLARDFPKPRTFGMTLADAGLSAEEFNDLFESQMMSRQLDLLARRMKARGESYYTIGSSGHEGNAAFGRAFPYQDPAFLHYRSGAFFIQRAKQKPGETPLFDLVLSLAASADDPIAGGRHKVFGSTTLNVPPQTSTIASHVPKAVGAALSIPRRRDLQLPGRFEDRAISIVSFGDASINHATALSGINTASWISYQGLPLPLVMICEDNGIGISVPTPSGWVAAAIRSRPGLRYFYCDGRDLLDTMKTAIEVEDYVRSCRKPAFLHMSTVRLLGHAGSDVETLYHTTRQIEQAEAEDPLLHSARIAVDQQTLTPAQIIEIYDGIRERLDAIAEEVVKRPKLVQASMVMKSIVPPKGIGQTPQPVDETKREALWGQDWQYRERPQHMAKLLNWALTDILAQYPNALVFGEDVAQKGGVYHVTAGLWKKFGSKRVFNSPLDETGILGTAIGLAHNGFLPIPEIQFLAYVHNAEDQIRGEAATLPFFSQGAFTNPMVIRIAGLAYQKGFGGHFHNDNSLAVFLDLPGVIVACPSNGADAVKMLRTCVRQAHERGRIVVFIEPIALYMEKDLELGDGKWASCYPSLSEEIALGEWGVHGRSNRLCIVSYGNGARLARQAAARIWGEHEIEVKVVDLRWLSEIDSNALAAEVEVADNVLVVDECRRSGSISERIVTMFVEHCQRLPRIQRVTAEDCFIPLGEGATCVLPSAEAIVDAALAMLARPRRRRRRISETMAER